MEPRESRELEEFEVGPEEHGDRLDVFLARLLPDSSRSAIQKLIKASQVWVDGANQKPSYTLLAGQVVAISETRNEPPSFEPKPAAFSILFEDDAVIVVDKPAGLVVHPGAGHHDTTLAQGLAFYLRENGGVATSSTNLRPGIVHRLDKDTSGVMVCAKTDAAHRHLAEQFRQKTNLREYEALLAGKLALPSQVYRSWLCRDPQDRLRFIGFEQLSAAQQNSGVTYREAISEFRLERAFPFGVSHVKVRLQTGRTHQIRVHARELGAPVLGDRVYGSLFDPGAEAPQQLRDALRKVERQLLHARLLGFEHPQTGEKLAFESPRPADLESILNLFETFSQ